MVLPVPLSPANSALMPEPAVHPPAEAPVLVDLAAGASTWSAIWRSSRLLGVGQHEVVPGGLAVRAAAPAGPGAGAASASTASQSAMAGVGGVSEPRVGARSRRIVGTSRLNWPASRAGGRRRCRPSACAQAPAAPRRRAARRRRPRASRRHQATVPGCRGSTRPVTGEQPPPTAAATESSGRPPRRRHRARRAAAGSRAARAGRTRRAQRRPAGGRRRQLEQVEPEVLGGPLGDQSLARAVGSEQLD